MLLRIVTWNCATALHTKYEHLLALKPDIAIVPECAEPDIVRRRAPGFSFSDCEWSGANPDKGLGVFAFGDLRMRLHQSWNRTYHLFLPVEVRGPELAVNLLAVWAFNHRTPSEVTPNPETTEAAVAYYAPFLQAAPAVVAGDFNASVHWDGKSRSASFASLNEKLEALGLTSAYHTYGKHAFDHEPHPTLLWQWNEERPYHIDYVYVPRTWIPCVRSVTVGSSADWVRPKVSDHVPVVVECDLPNQRALSSLAGLAGDALALTARAAITPSAPRN